MAFEELKERVCRANLGLVQAGLVILSWGNASGVDRSAGVMGIKPSGSAYDRLTPRDIVILSLQTGERVEGGGRPSSDTPTHWHLYRAFESMGGVVHTHSVHATSFAQAAREIPCLGTTHADQFLGTVPLTRALTPAEIKTDYELNTGKVIEECLRHRGLDPLHTAAVLVRHHGPFTWGASPEKALENALVLETTAQMALETYALNRQTPPIPDPLLQKHFFRKHGPDAYYGQT